MTTKQTVYPDDVLTGSHQKTAPISVDGTLYTEPEVLGESVAAYEGTDGAAPTFVTNALALPSVSTPPPQEITLRGVADAAHSSVAVTSRVIPLPSEYVAGDHLEVIVETQTIVSNDPGAPNTPSGWEQRTTQYPSVTLKPRITKFFKRATVDYASEQDVTITFPSSEVFHAVSRAWSGVSASNPYDIDEADIARTHGAYPDAPEPGAVTTQTPGAVVVVDAMGSKTDGFGTNSVSTSANYTKSQDEVPNDLAFANCYRTIDNPQVEQPGGYSWQYIQHFTAITDVLRADQGGVMAVLIQSASDGTEGAQLDPADYPRVGAQNEVQVVSDPTGAGGTWKITFDGEESTSMGANVNAGNLENELEGLSNISPGDVLVEGGPLQDEPLIVTFQGQYAETAVPLMTTNDAAIIVERQEFGSPEIIFDFEGVRNIPRAGPSNEPQLHFWSKIIDPYTPGARLITTLADHDFLTGWSQALLIIGSLDPTTPIEVIGTATSPASRNNTATWVGITPLTAGAKIVAVLAKALHAGFYDDEPSFPEGADGYTPVAQVGGSATTLDVWLSPPVDAIAADPPSSAFWSGDREIWTSFLLALKPSSPSSAGGDLNESVDEESESTWIEIAGAGGDMFEILELDMTPVPTDAYVTGMQIEFSHESTSSSPLRVTLVGIDGSGNPTLATEHKIGYVPTPAGSAVEVTTAKWTGFPDGSKFSDFSRYGVMIRSSQVTAGLASHRLYWVRAVVEFEENGPVVSDVLGTEVAGTSFSWSFSGDFPMTHYQVVLARGEVTDLDDTQTMADDVTDPGPLQKYFDSGKVPGAAVGYTLAGHMMHSNNTVAVRAWATLPNGESVVSDWAQDQFDSSDSQATVADQTNQPVFDPDTITMSIDLIVPAGVSRAWIVESVDGGTIFGEPKEFAIAGSGTVQVQFTPSLNANVTYRVSFDDGPHTSASFSKPIGTGLVDTAADGWYLTVPSDVSLNGRIDVEDYDLESGRISQVTEQPGAALVASSPMLSDRMTITVRTLTTAERERMEQVAAASKVEVTDTWGRRWTFAPAEPVPNKAMKLRDTVANSEILRDAHRFTLRLIEVPQ